MVRQPCTSSHDSMCCIILFFPWKKALMDKTPVKYSSALIDSIYLLAACRFRSSFQSRLSCDGWEWISWPHTLAGKMPLKVNKKRTREEHQIVMFPIWVRFTGRRWLIYLAVSISVSHKTLWKWHFYFLLPVFSSFSLGFQLFECFCRNGSQSKKLEYLFHKKESLISLSYGGKNRSAVIMQSLKS